MKKIDNVTTTDNRVKTILYSIISIALIYIILLFSGVIKYNNNNNINNNSNISSNESYIDTNVENKEEILKIIGLTEYGYERLNDDLKNQYKLSGDNYIDYNFYDIAKIFMDLSAGEYQVKDIGKEAINNLIHNYAIKNGIEINNIEMDAKSGSVCDSIFGCFVINEENYKKIAALYNLSENPSDVLPKYEDKYVLKSLATIDNPHQIKDSITMKNVSDGVEVKYDVNLEIVEEYKDNGGKLNKTITFNLKKNNEGNYYLDKIKVEDK